MEFKVLKISLSDVECVTKTQVKVRGPLWKLRMKKGIDNCFQYHPVKVLSDYEEAAKFATSEFKSLSASWVDPLWDELDWGRIKEMQTRDLLEHRAEEANKAQLGHCFDCPNFVKHVCTQVNLCSGIAAID